MILCFVDVGVNGFVVLATPQQRFDGTGFDELFCHEYKWDSTRQSPLDKWYGRCLKRVIVGMITVHGKSPILSNLLAYLKQVDRIEKNSSYLLEVSRLESYSFLLT